jgi:glutathione peroxidase
MSTFFDVDLAGLDGAELDLGALAGRTVLVVNVASRCGLTPQYEGLERLHRRYIERGFSVLGAPCNQFANQEPEDEGQIRTFCSTTYGTTFPLTEKLDVNGSGRHHLYRKLVDAPDGSGRAGDVEWNFEKFPVSPAGEVVARFRPGVAGTGTTPSPGPPARPPTDADRR